MDFDRGAVPLAPRDDGLDDLEMWWWRGVRDSVAPAPQQQAQLRAGLAGPARAPSPPPGVVTCARSYYSSVSRYAFCGDAFPPSPPVLANE